MVGLTAASSNILRLTPNASLLESCGKRSPSIPDFRNKLGYVRSDQIRISLLLIYD